MAISHGECVIVLKLSSIAIVIATVLSRSCDENWPSSSFTANSGFHWKHRFVKRSVHSVEFECALRYTVGLDENRNELRWEKMDG